MSDGEKKAEIAYIADGPAGMKVKGDDDRWYNPVNEEIRSKVKANLRVGDKVLIEYQEVPDSDNKRQVLEVVKANEDTTSSNESSEEPEAFQQRGKDREASKESKANISGSRWEDGAGLPRVEMPTRHGALNTAIRSLELEAEAGRNFPSSSEKIRELIESRALEFIDFIYSGSKQEWKDEKVKENHG